MNYSAAQVQVAIDGLKKKLGSGPSAALQQEFEAGLHPTLLSYDKVELSQTNLPVLTRYIVGATSFLHQPANYYNIFAACRCVNIVQFLDRGLTRLMSQEVVGLDRRLERLRKETRRDSFEALAFEVITAASYSAKDTAAEIEFLEETPMRKTPDFVVRTATGETFVECKKIDRTQNFTMAVRNAARELLSPILTFFYSRKVSALAQITFHRDPRQIKPAKLQKTCEVALKQGTAIIEPDVTAVVEHLPSYNSGEMVLYPSALFWWERYGYRIRSEWVGIVNQLHGRYCHRVDLPKALQGGASTWIDDIAWDSAAKWKVSSDEVLAKYRRFAFDGIFRGLDQLNGSRRNATIHVWLESDYYTGTRKETFFDLFQRVATARGPSLGWLVINETLFDISPKGSFDLIEHAHMIRGPAAIGTKPIASTVFALGDAIAGVGEFGTGVQLPDIDEQ